jgi:DUF1009 family protein
MNKIGIIAGEGSLPVIAARNAKELGFDVFVVGFEGFTSKEIENYSKVGYFKLGSVVKPINFLKTNGVNKVILLGKIEHVNIFREIRPDFRALRMIFKMRKDSKPMSVFRIILEELEKEQIEVIDSTVFIKDLIVPKGFIVGKVTDEEAKQIDYGYQIAKKIADMDIGLAITLKDFSVISVEGIDGTDECIKRTGSILGGKPFILIKVARTNQDLRFDLPVVGKQTIINMKNAKGKVIALESGKTIMVEKDEVLKIAKDSGIKIFGV